MASLSLDVADSEARTEEMREPELAEGHSTADAAARVFGVFELAENILEHVRPQDLLLWQQVNKSFRGVFNNSTRLHESMYLPTTHRAPKYRMLAVLPDFIFDSGIDRGTTDRSWRFLPLGPGIFGIKNIDDAPSPDDTTDYSWMHLPICQPAAKSMTMDVFKTGFFMVHEEHIEHQEGITVGHVVGAAARYILPYRQHNWKFCYRFTLHLE